MTLRILRAGALATVQDLGRRGLQHLGIVPGGAMDPASHRIANALVGNRDDAATLEVGLSGPEIAFDVAALVALHGAQFEATLDGERFPVSRPVLVPEGTRLSLGRALAGSFAYLAVAGGVAVPTVLGSRCTYLPGGFGGLAGKPVRRGSKLPLAPDVGERSLARFARASQRAGAVEVGGARSVRWFVPVPSLSFARTPVARAVDGVHAACFSDAARAALFAASWRIASESNRIGYRLEGPKLDLRQPAEIVSQATCLGTVQVPAGGQPIVLMADHQTTGGYPRIAEVIAADVPLVAQLAPRAAVRFARVKMDEADAAREAFALRVDRLIETVLREFGDEDD